jgi:hypothetical protein
VLPPLSRDHCILESINALKNITFESDIVMSVLFLEKSWLWHRQVFVPLCIRSRKEGCGRDVIEHGWRRPVYTQAKDFGIAY